MFFKVNNYGETSLEDKYITLKNEYQQISQELNKAKTQNQSGNRKEKIAQYLAEIREHHEKTVQNFIGKDTIKERDNLFGLCNTLDSVMQYGVRITKLFIDIMAIKFKFKFGSALFHRDVGMLKKC